MNWTGQADLSFSRQESMPMDSDNDSILENYELREDYTIELREDYSKELRQDG